MEADSAVSDLLDEVVIVRDDACGEVVLDAVEQLQHVGQLAVRVGGDDLEGSEELGRRRLEGLRRGEDGLERHEDCGGLDGAVGVGHGMASERAAAKGKLGAGQREARVYVCKDALGAP